MILFDINHLFVSSQVDSLVSYSSAKEQSAYSTDQLTEEREREREREDDEGF